MTLGRGEDLFFLRLPSHDPFLHVFSPHPFFLLRDQGVEPLGSSVIGKTLLTHSQQTHTHTLYRRWLIATRAIQTHSASKSNWYASVCLCDCVCVHINLYMHLGVVAQRADDTPPTQLLSHSHWDNQRCCRGGFSPDVCYIKKKGGGKKRRKSCFYSCLHDGSMDLCMCVKVNVYLWNTHW